MTDKEILAIDFYDFFGSAEAFATDEEKIKWYRKNILNEKQAYYLQQPNKTHKTIQYDFNRLFNRRSQENIEKTKVKRNDLSYGKTINQGNVKKSKERAKGGPTRRKIAN